MDRRSTLATFRRMAKESGDAASRRVNDVLSLLPNTNAVSCVSLNVRDSTRVEAVCHTKLSIIRLHVCQTNTCSSGRCIDGLSYRTNHGNLLRCRRSYLHACIDGSD